MPYADKEKARANRRKRQKREQDQKMLERIEQAIDKPINPEDQIFKDETIDKIEKQVHKERATKKRRRRQAIYGSSPSEVNNKARQALEKLATEGSQLGKITALRTNVHTNKSRDGALYMGRAYTGEEIVPDIKTCARNIKHREKSWSYLYRTFKHNPMALELVRIISGLHPTEFVFCLFQDDDTPDVTEDMGVRYDFVLPETIRGIPSQDILAAYETLIQFDSLDDYIEQSKNKKHFRTINAVGLETIWQRAQILIITTGRLESLFTAYHWLGTGEVVLDDLRAAVTLDDLFNNRGRRLYHEIPSSSPSQQYEVVKQRSRERQRKIAKEKAAAKKLGKD